MPLRTSSDPIQLDGRTLEGGGQLLRIALCLSALTGQSIEIQNIRGNRSSGGGLKSQHLACVKWLALATEAKLTGAEKASSTLLFEPCQPSTKLSPAYVEEKEGGSVFSCEVDIGTAGSTGLVLQAILPYILFAPPPIGSDGLVQLHLKGGTNVSGSPSFEYVSQVLLPTLESIGLPRITAKLVTRGWSTGRSGHGSYNLDIPVSGKRSALSAFQLRPLDIDSKPNRPSAIRATFLGPTSVHAHLQTVLVPALQHYFGQDCTEETAMLRITCEDSGDNKRLYLIVVATVPGTNHAKYRLGRDWLYDRKIRNVQRVVTEMSERVAVQLYDEWRSGAWIDEHMRDQLVIFQALADGRSAVWPGQQSGIVREPDLHARTAEWVAKEMVGARFSAEDECEGIGFVYAKDKQAEDDLIDKVAGIDLYH